VKRRIGALAAAVLATTVIGVGAARIGPVAAAISTIDLDTPAGATAFGTEVVVLSNGNFVVRDLDVGARGAVRLYDGATNTLISTLRGSAPDDMIGADGIIEVGDGNFIVSSPYWDNGMANSAGAVTWVNGTTGLDGTVSPANSLVGTSPNDSLGAYAISVLANGNYVVPVPTWGPTNIGAITWSDGSHGVTGPISAANSLIGSHTDDLTALRLVELTNSNIVATAPNWDSTAATDVGAATWINGATGTTGIISAANSLVGTTANDYVGSNTLQPLTNGNYVVDSPFWDSPTAADAGAATWGDGAHGTSGDVSVANSLIGQSPGDVIGNAGVRPLANGNYVVGSNQWHNGVIPAAGAATWGDGASGTNGVVSDANSIHGTYLGDGVGEVFELTNGNYVVSGPTLSLPTKAAVGAAMWASGSGPTAATMDETNSIVGATAGDHLGQQVIALTNGNYVVMSRWQTSGVDVGATTWAPGDGPSVFSVNPTNSLVYSHAGDWASIEVVPLTNGNYIVAAPNWAKGGAMKAGAVTWGSGTSGATGVVSEMNSVVGDNPEDRIGLRTVALPNGNALIASVQFDSGMTINVGMVRVISGSGPTVGAVNSTNSLLGSHDDDNVGASIEVLADGNAVISEPLWDNGGLADAGAVTWISAIGATAGRVSSVNSIVGSNAGDSVGGSHSELLPDGAFVFESAGVDVAGNADAGAVTYVDPGGLVGTLSPSNSVFGAQPMQGGDMSTSRQYTKAHGVVVGRQIDNKVTLMVPPPTVPPTTPPTTPAPTTPGSVDFVPLPPVRLADTRAGFTTIDGADASGGLRDVGSTLELHVAGRGGVALNASAVALNVTAVDAVAPGFATAWPCGETRPTASNLNFDTGATVPNAVLAKVGAGGNVCLFTSQPIHFVVDVTGYTPVTTSYHPLNPARLIDTRGTGTTIDGQQQAAGAVGADSTTTVQVHGRGGVPGDATSVVLNVTTTESIADGYVTAYPCEKERPNASSVNGVARTTVANLVIAKVSNAGTVCLYSQSPTHLIADVNGYFSSSGSFVPLVPARVMDTRSSAAGTTIDGQAAGAGSLPLGTVTHLLVNGRGGVPNATTVVLNVTVTEPGAPGYVSAYPCGIDPPNASNLNYATGQTVANGALVKIGDGGTVCFYNSQPTHLVVDVTGYFGT